VHANAWRQVGRFFDLTTEPDLKIVCGREGQAAEKAAQKLGFREHATSWNGVVRWPGIDVVDAVLRLVLFEGGAIGSIEGSGFCPGRKNHNRFEINRSKGSLVFDLERMNELEAYQEAGPDGGFRTVLATDETHPFVEAWWPPGHGLGYEHTFTHMVLDLVRNGIGHGPEAELPGRGREPARSRRGRAVEPLAALGGGLSRGATGREPQVCGFGRAPPGRPALRGPARGRSASLLAGLVMGSRVLLARPDRRAPRRG
jgi:predicted dehydrogenase